MCININNMCNKNENININNINEILMCESNIINV